MSARGSIPSLAGQNPLIARVLGPIIEILEGITGRRPQQGRIAELPSDATLPQLVAKVNEVIVRLQQ